MHLSEFVERFLPPCEQPRLNARWGVVFLFLRYSRSGDRLSPTTLVGKQPIISRASFLYFLVVLQVIELPCMLVFFLAPRLFL